MTFKFITTKAELSSVKLRICTADTHTDIATKLKMTRKELNSLLEKPSKSKVYECAMLDLYMSAAKEINIKLLAEGRASEDVKVIRQMILERIGLITNTTPKKQKGNFLPFFHRCLDAKPNEGYKSSLNYTISKIKEYCGEKADMLSFDDINLKWLNDFDTWLVSQNLKKNSRNIHFKNIRTVFNRAIDEEVTTKYPFRRFKIRPEATRKRSMPVNELRKLFTCEVEPYQEIYRDMFKLIFMLCGINCVDLYNLKSITSDGRVEYRRAKTKRLYSIKVEPEAMEIINKYRGEKNLLCLADRWSSHKDFTKWINSALKKIGEMRIVGRGGKKEIKPFWPDISSYWARHSFATIAYNDCGISKDIISQALGHNSGTSITEVYLDKNQSLVDKANRKLLDYVLYDKI